MISIECFEVKYNHIAATYHQAVVTTAAGDSSTQRGGGIGKSLGWENVVSSSNQATVIVSSTNKHVHISFYGTGVYKQWNGLLEWWNTGMVE